MDLLGTLHSFYLSFGASDPNVPMEQVPKMQKLLRKLDDPEITFEDAIKISQECIEIYRKVNEDRKKLGKPIFKIPKLEKD